MDTAWIEFLLAFGASVCLCSCISKAFGTGDTITLLAADRHVDELLAIEALQGLRLLFIQAEQLECELEWRVFDACKAQKEVTLSVCRFLQLALAL